MFRTQLLKQGFAIIPNAVDSGFTKRIKVNIQNHINLCADDMGCTVPHYLSHVSNWQYPSPVLNNVSQNIVDTLSSVIKKLIDNSAECIRTNLISRTRYSCNPIPCHQDISYLMSDVYSFSSWLALQNIEHDSAPLEVLPYSHLDDIHPPVDFMIPGFVDKMRLSARWREHSVPLFVKAGDLIIFDSRLWHGSGFNKSKMTRHAIVNRWKTQKAVFDYFFVPNLNVQFGMWNWIEISEKIVLKSLKNIYGVNEKNFISALDMLAQEIDNSNEFSWDVTKAIDSLKSLKILYLAYFNHNAKDPQGVVYRNIWEHCLKHLNEYCK